MCSTSREDAAAVDLVLSDDEAPGIRRVRRGRDFSYHHPDGTLLEGADRERCAELAVPVRSLVSVWPRFVPQSD